MTQEMKPRILVIGVGGAGGNAVNNMIEANLQGVEFIAANTDAQALGRSRAATRIQLGAGTTSGLGAGAKPEIGARAAEESLEEIRSKLEGAHMVFVAAGMGGGTGTGAAPVIARVAQEMGILTIAVVTKPFGFEGAHRMRLAESGLSRIRNHVDTMIVVPNQNLFRITNDRTTVADAFRMADDVLYSGVRGITDLIVMPGLINLDFADVSTIMRGMGTALMGMGEATGEGRAVEAARRAIDNPLLDDVTIKGARGVLINITGGYDMTLFELDEAASEIRREVDPDANIILGSAFDEALAGRVRVCVVAAGLDAAARRLPAAEPPAVTVRQTVASHLGDPDGLLEPELPSLLFSDATVAPEQRPPDATAAAKPPAPDAGDRPVVIAPARQQSSAVLLAEPASAPEVEGLPVGDRQAGEIFDEPSDAPAAADSAAPVPGARQLSALFGMRLPGMRNEPGRDKDPGHAVSTADDRMDPAPFDDLEIPAFLRRSGNH